MTVWTIGVCVPTLVVNVAPPVGDASTQTCGRAGSRGCDRGVRPAVSGLGAPSREFSVTSSQQPVQRVHRESLDNVAVKLGSPDNPMLPPRSFDRILMVHMYHEVESPYAFLWHMREGLKPDGQVIVVDANREPKRHGIQPRLVACEFAAVGLKLIHVEPIAEGENYFASFRIAGPRPEPEQIRACKG